MRKRKRRRRKSKMKEEKKEIEKVKKETELRSRIWRKFNIFSLSLSHHTKW